MENLLDLNLAIECAKSFSNHLGVGTSIVSVSGEVLYENGFSCSKCELCNIINKTNTSCIQSHIYGMNESARFGGKYIYFGPYGFTFFSSPIISATGISATIIVGPFLMVEKQDYIDVDLVEFLKLEDSLLQEVIDYLDNVPYLSPEKVSDLSSLLFMAVGFMNSVMQTNKLLSAQKSSKIQSNISNYIHSLKDLTEIPPYPFETENKLLSAVANTDRPLAQKYLNEILGYIFFSTGSNFSMAKSRVYELLVLISRTSIKNGANSENCLILTHNYLQIIPQIDTMEALTLWLSEAMNELMDNLFKFMDVKHANVIYTSIQYIRNNYQDKLTLEQVSRRVYLSPAYFSRVFKKETGDTFSNFLNKLRIEKSKDLLRLGTDKLSNIALAVGFEDQSYFTKVFKKIVGVSPHTFRENFHKSIQ